MRRSPTQPEIWNRDNGAKNSTENKKLRTKLTGTKRNEVQCYTAERILQTPEMSAKIVRGKACDARRRDGVKRLNSICTILSQ